MNIEKVGKAEEMRKGDNMEKINYLPNGQWTLEKGAMNRLAPKTKGKEVQFWDGAGEPHNDAALTKRGQASLVKQHMGNDGAFKKIDGNWHMMLHRGMGGDEYDPKGPMKINKDNSLEHKEHGIYTDSHNYASSFAGEGSGIYHQPNSVWVPINNINRNTHYEHDAWEKRQTSNMPDHKKEFFEGMKVQDENMDDTDEWMKPDDVMDMYETGEIMPRGNHILVNPGKYQSASEEEVHNYLKAHKPNHKANKSAVESDPDQQEDNADHRRERYTDYLSHNVHDSWMSEEGGTNSPREVLSDYLNDMGGDFAENGSREHHSIFSNPYNPEDFK